MPEDVRKALADFHTSGRQYYPIRLADGGIAWGAARYARLIAENGKDEGWFEPGVPCLISKPVGAGAVYYVGANLGQRAKKDPVGLVALMRKAVERAGIRAAGGLRGTGLGQVRVDMIANAKGPRCLMVLNRSDQDQTIQLDQLPDGHGLFSGLRWRLSEGAPVQVPGGFVDLIVLDSFDHDKKVE